MNVVDIKSRASLEIGVSEFYRNHRIVVTSEGKNLNGVIKKKGVPIFSCSGLDTQFINQHLRSVIDRLLERGMRERKNALPSDNELAIAARSISQEQVSQFNELFRYFSTCDEGEFSTEGVQTALSLDSSVQATFLMASCARSICDAIPFCPPNPIDGRDPYLAYIFDEQLLDSDSGFKKRYKLRDNIRQALSQI